MTNDVDLVVVLEREIIGRLSEAFPADQFYLPSPEEIAGEAAKPTGGHFNIVHHESGFKADMYPAGNDPLHEWALARGRRIEMGDGETLMIAPPEYVIVRKLEYFREGGSEKHLRDIRSMLTHSAEEISTAELESWIASRGLEEAWSKAKAWAEKR